MTLEQCEALWALEKALEEASTTSVLDLLAEDVHPDHIDELCDAVSETAERVLKEGYEE